MSRGRFGLCVDEEVMSTERPKMRQNGGMGFIKTWLAKEWPLVLSYGSLIAVLTIASDLFVNPTGTGQIAIAFSWLFIVILLAAFAVVYHAECLAEKLGEPYGTLILTLSVIGLEVIMIATVMVTKEDNPLMARDTMFGVLMIVLNGLFGIAILVGAWRHKVQKFNVQSSDTFLGGIVLLVGIGLVLPNFVAQESLHLFEVYLGIMCILMYGVFLWVQTKEHRGFFVYKRADGGEEEPHINSSNSVTYHVVHLILTLIPVVILAKQLSVVMYAGLSVLNWPDAIAGLAVAILILAPEGLAAIKAGLHNNLQRALNICLGSALATIGLTIPVVLIVCLIAGEKIRLGLDNEDLVLIVITIMLLKINLDKGETNVLKGLLHLIVFASYCAFIFIW